MRRSGLLLASRLLGLGLASLFAPGSVLSADGHAHHHSRAGVGPRSAQAQIEPLGAGMVRGEATFQEKDGKVVLQIRVSGATPGPHAMHLHEIGDCSAADGASAGGHWNPTGEEHGGPHHHHGQGHRGDVGNIQVGPDGTGTFEMENGDWSVGGAPETDVLGRSLIIHAGVDDFQSQPGGSSGDRIACGVVRPVRGLTP